MLASLFYLILRRVLGLVSLGSNEQAKDIEILLLRHQLKVVGRKVGRARLRRRDRVLLAAASRVLPRDRWASFLVTPQGRRGARAKTYTERDAIPIHLMGEAGVTEIASARSRTDRRFQRMLDTPSVISLSIWLTLAPEGRGSKTSETIEGEQVYAARTHRKL